MSPKLYNLFLVVASGALYFIIISPLYTGAGTLYVPEQGLTQLRELSASYDATIAQAEKLVDQSEKMQQDFIAISPETKATLAVMIPDAIDEVRLISEINSIANNAGFAIDNIAYNQSPSAQGKIGVSAYNVTFTTKGSYDGFKKLLNNFETSRRIYAIKSVSITPPDEGGSQYTFQVKVETYYMNIK